jgi:hypothetical protein
MKFIVILSLCSGVVFANPIHKYNQKSFSSEKQIILSDQDRIKCINVMKQNNELNAKSNNPGNMFFISDDKCKEIIKNSK